MNISQLSFTTHDNFMSLYNLFILLINRYFVVISVLKVYNLFSKLINNLYEFARAAVTKYYKLGHLNNRKTLSLGSGG